MATEPNPMDDLLVELEGHRCLVMSPEGPPIADANGARDLIEAALSEEAQVVAVPVERLDAAFFQLRSGLAGEVLQKCANYGLTLAVVGDVSAHTAASEAFRDLVVEADRGTSLLFVTDLGALQQRLGKIRPSSR
jgi:hypothetical protein